MFKKFFKDLLSNKNNHPMQITLTWKNVELSSKQKDYIEQKIRSLSKFFNNITSARIEVGLETKKHNKGKIYYAHVNLNVPGKVLRVEELEPSIEKAIDKAKDDLQVEIKKYKARFDKKGKNSIKNISSDMSSESLYYEQDINQDFSENSSDF